MLQVLSLVKPINDINVQVRAVNKDNHGRHVWVNSTSVPLVLICFCDISSTYNILYACYSMFKQHAHMFHLMYLQFLHHVYAVPEKISGVMLSLTAVSGGAAISVTWDTPVDDVAIDHYEVVYVVSEHPVTGKTVNSTIESHVITGLVQGVVYSVQVRAVSEVGGHAGEYSEVESITTPVGEK